MSSKCFGQKIQKNNLIPRKFEDSQFIDLVDVGEVAFSVETIIRAHTYAMHTRLHAHTYNNATCTHLQQRNTHTLVWNAICTHITEIFSHFRKEELEPEMHGLSR